MDFDAARRGTRYLHRSFTQVPAHAKACVCWAANQHLVSSAMHKKTTESFFQSSSDRALFALALAFFIALMCAMVLIPAFAQPRYAFAGFVRGSDALSTGADSRPPHLLLSLLTRDDAEWLSFWLNVTARAMQINYSVIISSTPSLQAAHEQAAATSAARGHVFFSEPFEKHTLGHDLLRAHVRNLHAATALAPDYTHVSLLASNALWIRPVYPTSLLQHLHTRVKFGALSNDWVWAGAARSDECLRRWAARLRLGLQAGQVEGWSAIRAAAEAALPELDRALLCNERGDYPSEEIAFPSIAAHLQSGAWPTGFGRIGAVQWNGGPDMRFTDYEIADFKADEKGPLFVKRVMRNASDPYTLRASEFSAFALLR
jgi:hypothetical protein